jgi:hypothetical protein
LLDAQRRAASKDDAHATARMLLQKAESRIGHLDDALSNSETRKREEGNPINPYSCVISSVAQMASCKNSSLIYYFPLPTFTTESNRRAAEAEMARLKEDLALGRTYAEGLMVQIGGMDRERERERDVMPVAGDLRRALAVQQNEVRRRVIQHY